MKAVAVILSGIAVALAGAFIRSCTEDFPPEFALSWCGHASRFDLLAASHAHCAGCAFIAVGLMLIAIAPAVAELPNRLAATRALQ